MTAAQCENRSSERRKPEGKTEKETKKKKKILYKMTINDNNKCICVAECMSVGNVDKMKILIEKKPPTTTYNKQYSQNVLPSDRYIMQIRENDFLKI